MRAETIGEAVDVGVVFKSGRRPVPKWFLWGGRKHDVRSVEMTWKAKDGETLLLFFSVTDGHNVYELRLNQKTLEWMLEKVYLE
ncbi:MAG: hypothetical protein HY548_06370 [Elusimicrobia bacterium]|nr:hypothetical protein [Elusimicrobiota bacterium]